jgi:hypothetical protein
MNWVWLAGFHEGEGCFTFVSKHNNTSRNGKRYYYKRRQPQWVLSQIDRRILDLIAEFLCGKGIRARVWRKSNKPTESHKWEVRVVGWANCNRLAKLLRPRLLAEHKQEQLDRWIKTVAEDKPAGSVPDSMLLGEVP